jgi:hypothetical protein
MVALALSLVFGVQNASVSGKWQGSFRVDGGDHDVPQLFQIKQEGNNLAGSGGPDATERYPIANGQVNGDRVTFDLTTGDWKFSYDLKAAEKEMNGKLTLKSATDSRTAQVSIKKSE